MRPIMGLFGWLRTWGEAYWGAPAADRLMMTQHVVIKLSSTYGSSLDGRSSAFHASASRVALGSSIRTRCMAVVNGQEVGRIDTIVQLR